MGLEMMMAGMDSTQAGLFAVGMAFAVGHLAGVLNAALGDPVRVRLLARKVANHLRRL